MAGSRTITAMMMKLSIFGTFPLFELISINILVSFYDVIAIFPGYVLPLNVLSVGKSHGRALFVLRLAVWLCSHRSMITINDWYLSAKPYRIIALKTQAKVEAH